MPCFVTPAGDISHGRFLINLTKVSLSTDHTQAARAATPIHLIKKKQIMKRILVPCDFSGPSKEAIKFAAFIARKSKGEIVLFHSLELPVLYDSNVVMAFEASFMKDTQQKAVRDLEQLAKKLVGSTVKTKIEIQFGGFVPMLEQAVDKLKVDLIVMGTHGATGLKEYTIGSNAERVVRKSSVPVISVRKFEDQVKNIVFPIKPGMEDDEDLTMRVKNLQEFFGAKVHILFVNTPALFKRDSETLPMLAAFAKRYMFKNYTINIFSDIAEEEGIINFTKTVEGDLVTMRTHGRRGIAHLATGSVAEDVVNHINCPIWTYKVK